MKQVFAVWLLTGVGANISVMAQENYVKAIAPEPNKIVGQVADGKTSGDKTYTRFGLTDQNFPQIVSGGSWETVIVIVNMSAVSIPFQQRFFDESGQPMPVTFRTFPEGTIITDTAIEGRLNPGSSFNFALFDSGQPLQVGWGTLSYDARLGRLGAYAILRQRVPGKTDAEALVPLSAYDDTDFFMSIDNIQGFVTAIAIVNPASNLQNLVRLTFLALDGTIIGQDSITLPPSGHIAFSIPARYPVLAGRLATLLVKSNLTRLAAMGLRFNPNFAFSSIPIMNWSGML